MVLGSNCIVIFLFSERDQLKKQVQEVKTVSGIPYYNILLVGEVGSGKSSYFNAINSVMNDCVIKDTAKAGFKSESTTKKVNKTVLYDMEIARCHNNKNN